VISVCHVITTLAQGGAQALLYDLLRHSGGGDLSFSVISLRRQDGFAPRIRALGIPTHELDLNTPLGLPATGAGVTRLLRNTRPDVVHTWLYHADLVGSLCARLAGRRRIVWGVHHVADSGGRGPAHGPRPLVRVGAWVSRTVPRAVVYCSDAAMRSHLSAGYDPNKARVIHNGVDTDRFRPDPAARARIRKALGIGVSTPLIGYVARYHPLKRHDTFLAAAAILAARRDVRFLLCGDGTEPGNPSLEAAVRRAGLDPRIHLLGMRSDVEAVTAALDVATCCSETESFSLATAEAMACGVPCAATAIPSVLEVLGSEEHTVPVGDADGLAAAWSALLDLPPDTRETMAASMRRRVATQFSIARMADAYRELYRELCGADAPPAVNSGAGLTGSRLET
jgi:glycosyltransferase involved in cell wall biosynthesis